MATLMLQGAVGPDRSFSLDDRLAPLTTQIRPQVTVDLAKVTELHPAVVSVLIRHQQRAARLGGDLGVIPPSNESARHTIDQIGLCRLRRS